MGFIAQGRRWVEAWRWHCPSSLSTEKRGLRCLFITVSEVISWFIKIDLKQIYCSFSGTQKIQN